MKYLRPTLTAAEARLALIESLGLDRDLVARIDAHGRAHGLDFAMAVKDLLTQTFYPDPGF